MKINFLVTALMFAALSMPVVAQTAPTNPEVIAFEKYESAESFNAAMNEAFPVGSSYEALKQKLLASGAYETANPATPNPVFIYSKKSGMLFHSVETRWTVTVSAKNDIIRTISTNYGLTGL